MAVAQYSNITFLGMFLIFTTTLSFMAGKPITEFQFWEHNRDTLAPWIFGFLSISMAIFTLNKQRYFGTPQPVQPLTMMIRLNTLKTRGIFIIGNLLILAIAIACQYMLADKNWEGKRSFEIFVVSNLVMTTIYNVFMTERVIEAHHDSPFQLLIPVYTALATSSFFPYITQGDSWMYHYYYNLLIAVCSVELHTALDHDIFKIGQSKNQVNVVAESESEPESDLEFESAPSSDNEWDRVEYQEDH